MSIIRPFVVPLFAALLLPALLLVPPSSAAEPRPIAATPDLTLTETEVTYRADLDALVFDLTVKGRAGATEVTPAGQMDGAPVLAYAVPTTLKPEQLGFAPGPGVLALVATSHPDFDDTPLWDENGNGDTTDADDGRIFHTHWVVLVPDERVAGGLSVKPVEGDPKDVLPPTAPGMPIYLDSPGHTVLLQGNRLRIVVPGWRIRNLDRFNYDGVTAYLQVNASDESRPTLGIYKVYSVLSGDLSLPKTFKLP
ncbi:MAG: hypothetical protein AAF772_00255 [Acidobacteriota bacterium]